MEMDTAKSTNNLLHLTGESKADDLGGVYFRNTQYYDMAKIEFINNSGIVDLLDLVKAWSELGIEVRFVNVKPGIKKQVNELDMENIILFS